ncbi:zinc finger domain-containing protein [Kitasatospora mediocidica]|uniref:zinc finger domain-containing protein n=1 Tax=Kitasatospora mediocidica TaxID=58352 RepID=UPI00068F09F4|nr:hypothetical protein [Kitasatospora mediocidica]
MTPSEAATLLGHIAAFDRRTIGEVDARAWAAALHDTPLDRDTLNAVARYFATPPEKPDARRWLEPHHVRTLRAEIRAERIPDGAFTYPALGRDETGAEFVQRRRAQIQAIADGRLQAEPIREIAGGPHPNVAQALNEIGRMPEHIRAELAQAGIGAKRGNWPELAIPCPLHACRALANRPCQTSKGKRMVQGTHPSRRDAWEKAQDLYVTDRNPQEAS